MSTLSKIDRIILLYIGVPLLLLGFLSLRIGMFEASKWYSEFSMVVGFVFALFFAFSIRRVLLKRNLKKNKRKKGGDNLLTINQLFNVCFFFAVAWLISFYAFSNGVGQLVTDIVGVEENQNSHFMSVSRNRGCKRSLAFVFPSAPQFKQNICVDNTTTSNLPKNILVEVYIKTTNIGTMVSRYKIIKPL